MHTGRILDQAQDRSSLGRAVLASRQLCRADVNGRVEVRAEGLARLGVDLRREQAPAAKLARTVEKRGIDTAVIC